MREQGLEKAISAAGGISALARGLGIAQPSLSTWSKVPAERVLAVESLTGISRSELRPDLYPQSGMAAEVDIDELDQLRADEYGMLALLLFRAPTTAVLGKLSGLKGDVSPLGMAHMALGMAAAEAVEAKVGREFFDLFVGVGRGELLPFASYYLTGFLHERPLAEVRQAFINYGIVRDDNSKEPEDHIAILFDVMAGMATRRFGDGFADEKAFFETHIKPWAARFFDDLCHVEGKPFYRAVGEVGRLFIAIETEAFSFDH